MLKQILCALLIIGSLTAFAQDALLLNQDFKEGLKHWASRETLALPENERGFKVETIDGVQCVIAFGTTDFKDNPQKQLRQTINIQEKPLKHTITFKLSINPVKISGTFNFMIREVDAQGKTIRYRKITLDKWAQQGWKEYSQNFTAMSPTAAVQVFIQSMYFQPGDKVLMKDLKLEIKKYEP